MIEYITDEDKDTLSKHYRITKVNVVPMFDITTLPLKYQNEAVKIGFTVRTNHPRLNKLGNMMLVSILEDHTPPIHEQVVEIIKHSTGMDATAYTEQIAQMIADLKKVVENAG